jgi:hypothetical protein
MTRKIHLSDLDKDFIATSIRDKVYNVTQLANMFGCHPKTINRAMAEKGVARLGTSHKRNVDGARALALLKTYGVTVDQLAGILSKHTYTITPAGAPQPNTPSLNARQRTAALFRPAVANLGVGA